MRDEEIYRQVGRQIAGHRRRLKLTQKALATKVGMSRASVANTECGRQSVLLHQLYRFAEALSLSDISELLPAGAMSARNDFELLGVPLSDDNLSAKDKAEITNMVSKAVMAHRQSKGNA